MRRYQLTRQAMQVLRPALLGAKGTVKREIEQGVSQLYKTGGLYVVIRPEGDELVVVAVAGKGLFQSRQEIINFAYKNNYQSIRFHTRHPKRIQRALDGLPIVLVEVRKSLLLPDELVFKLEL